MPVNRANFAQYASDPATINLYQSLAQIADVCDALEKASGVTVGTVASAGAATTDSIAWSPNAEPADTTNALLTISVYPTAGNVNVLVCNPTAASITPSAETLNWRVVR